MTIYGAVDKTDLIHFDSKDGLLKRVYWKQVAPDAVQIVIEPRSQKWWGYDTRYEGGALVVEVRKPWMKPSMQGMVIAVDPGHGSVEKGAIGPHGTMEKEANLQIAPPRGGKSSRRRSPAVPDREDDRQVPLLERGRIALGSPRAVVCQRALQRFRR